MIKARHFSTSTPSGSGTYSNERQIGRALLPERFESTSVPSSPASEQVEMELCRYYALPIASETPVFEDSASEE